MGIYIGTGPQRSHFDHNRFYNIFTGGLCWVRRWRTDASGIFGYGLSRSTITDEIFINVNEGCPYFL